MVWWGPRQKPQSQLCFLSLPGPRCPLSHVSEICLYGLCVGHADMDHLIPHFPQFLDMCPGPSCLDACATMVPSPCSPPPSLPNKASPSSQAQHKGYLFPEALLIPSVEFLWVPLSAPVLVYLVSCLFLHSFNKLY